MKLICKRHATTEIAEDKMEKDKLMSVAVEEWPFLFLQRPTTCSIEQKAPLRYFTRLQVNE